MPDLRPRAALWNIHASPSRAALRCDVFPERQRVRVAPVGDIDLATAPDLERTVRELLDAGFAELVVDLEGVQFMDSTGLQLILGLHDEALHGAFRLALKPGPRAVQRVFELTGTTERLPFAPHYTF